MNAEFINPFLSSISKVLATMAMLDIRPGKALLARGVAPKSDVTGLVSMKSPKVQGTLAISFSDQALHAITERMLGESISDEDLESIDNMLGEITNMVTGGAKQIFETKGFDFDMAIPTVYRDKNTADIHRHKDRILVVPYTTDLGEFYVSISFA